ncbi:hypothetical protein CAEBREN_08823 [Caenorhabditis brenneri]|uniref:Uncharacterized protein n=1 Tax=Caenorhabditis brenneri TaxID=135651 RepID=G0N1M9_CAEBE|nr:hypothetical protein CAEBREN_08823 [Caenorhabditis brenneri]
MSRWEPGSFYNRHLLSVYYFDCSAPSASLLEVSL